MKTAALITGAALLLSGSAAAQTAPTGVQIWGGLGTDAYILPTLSLGLSADVVRQPQMTVALYHAAKRGDAPAMRRLQKVGAELRSFLQLVTGTQSSR